MTTCLIVSDSFKGTLTALEAARNGVKRIRTVRSLAAVLPQAQLCLPAARHLNIEVSST